MSSNAFSSNRQYDKKLYIRRWVVTILYTLFIYATLPLFPTVWGFATQLFPDGVVEVDNGIVIALRGLVNLSEQAGRIVFIASAPLVLLGVNGRACRLFAGLGLGLLALGQ